MNRENKLHIGRRKLLASIGAAGLGIAGVSLLGKTNMAVAAAPNDWFNVKTDYAAVGDGIADDTAAIQSAITAAAAVGGTVYIPPGTYKVVGTITVGPVTIECAYGTIIKHKPSDNNTDCLVISGLNAGRTRIKGLQIKGLQDGHTFGRDLIRISKGDYVTLEDVYLEFSKRDAVHIEPSQSNYWIENLLMINVKIQDPQRDSFHYAIPAVLTGVFINQVTMINCESRSAVRHALALVNANEVHPSYKISCLKVLNCELAGIGATTTPLVILSGSVDGGDIENISFEDSVIEDTTASRLGEAVLITGKMSGLFQFNNSNHFGTPYAIVGFDRFPHYFYRNILNSASVSLYSSHMGLYKKYRTASLTQNAFEDTYQLQDGEIIKGYVLDRYNNGSWYAEFTCWDTSRLFVATQNSVTVTLNNSFIRLTNTSATAASLELFLQRVTKDTAN